MPPRSVTQRRPALSVDLQSLATKLEGFAQEQLMAEGDSAIVLLEPFQSLMAREYRVALNAFDSFLPPRLVRSAASQEAVIFFGAGVSAGAGIPMWWDLLQTLGVPRDLIDEPEVAGDPLTAAEVLAHEVGIPDLDERLRRRIEKRKDPTAAHFLLAALNQNVYLTTNYDCLFEVAWEKMYNVEPRVVTTDADIATLKVNDLMNRDKQGRPTLFKLHGSSNRKYEELILTRSQYRRHYRTNQNLFSNIRALLGTSNTLFLGFGHRDPEITRLVEDVIHVFETGASKKTPDPKPAFYSLQYNMGPRVPEIFAARGIVALEPPRSLEVAERIDPRTVALTRALIDLVGALDSDVHKSLDLDDSLSEALAHLASAVEGGLKTLDKLSAEKARRGSVTQSKLDISGTELGALAGQGIYILNAAGEIDQYWFPSGQNEKVRTEKDLADRSYVRQARMYRQPFASSSEKSIFNENSTVFLCAPVLGPAQQYNGLVFSAVQVGSWTIPLELRDKLLREYGDRGLSVLLIDNHGVLLLPPDWEFKPIDAKQKPAGEAKGANLGFNFDGLRRLSRRDKLVERVWNNIVPLAQDDDVINLGEDVRIYSVVADIPRTRWKLALSIPT